MHNNDCMTKQKRNQNHHRTQVLGLVLDWIVKLVSFGHILAFSTAQSVQAVSGALPAEPVRSWKGAPHWQHPPLLLDPAASFTAFLLLHNFIVGHRRALEKPNSCFTEQLWAFTLGCSHVKRPNLLLLGQKLKCCSDSAEMQHLPGRFVDLERCLRGLFQGGVWAPSRKSVRQALLALCQGSAERRMPWGFSSFNSAMNLTWCLSCVHQ